MITFNQVKQNPQIQNFIKLTDEKLEAMNYTDHGQRHANITKERAMMVAKKVGLNQKEIEYSGIAGYCHDMGNFLDRKQHHYWTALLFHQVFSDHEDYKGVAQIIQAIANHNKDEARLTNNVSATLILADKSDVDRSRVVEKDINRIKESIHDRVNYSVTDSDLEIDSDKKVIELEIKLDTKITPIMDYFEIFLPRMNYCRKASEYLGFKFKLEINEFELL